MKLFRICNNRLRSPLFLIVIGLLFRPVGSVRGQPFTRDDYSVPVTANGQLLDHPFTGGLYNPMHQFADIDSDGDLDMFIYEVYDGNLFFYRNIGTPESAAFRLEREPFVKPPVFGWFRVADVNGDGKLDILTSPQTGNTLAIYLNNGTPQVPLFSLLTTSFLDSAGVPVYAESFSIGSVVDIDGDGDLDFFSLNSAFGTINYYENTGDATDFSLAFRTNMWQGIRICIGCGSSAPHTLDSTLFHGNGTMHFADINADQDYDMFYGDLFDGSVFYFENTGTVQSAVMDSLGPFPATNPIMAGGFPQPTMPDIDNDGDVDMFISVLFPLQRVDNFRFYTNIGTPQNFNFQLTSSNYLKTLDFGLQAAPAFADIDADGDQDLFVGNLDGKLAFLRNTGTNAQPAFLLEDSAFISNSMTYTYSPLLADIDADGDLDMLLGKFLGTIEFYRNTGTTTSANFERELWVFDTLSVTTYSVPAMFDIDNDGDLDMFIGRGLGTISYYQNDGSPQVPSFSLVSTNFLGIDVGDNSKPFFVDEDQDGDFDLLVGASDGKLQLYRNDGPPGNPTFTLETDFYADADSVRESSPAMTDIDGDGDQDLLLGNYRGGVELYRNELLTSVPSSDGGEIPLSTELQQNYPNPFNASTVIRFSVPSRSAVELKIYDVLGREVQTLVRQTLSPGHYRVSWDGTSAASGIYFYRLTAGGFASTRKLLLLR